MSLNEKIIVIVPLEMKGMACLAGPHGGVTRVGQKAEGTRGKNRSQVHWGFMGKERQGLDHWLVLPRRNSSCELSGRGDVLNCLVPGPGLIWGRRNIGVVCEN